MFVYCMFDGLNYVVIIIVIISIAIVIDCCIVIIISSIDLNSSSIIMISMLGFASQVLAAIQREGAALRYAGEAPRPREQIDLSLCYLVFVGLRALGC